MKSVLLMPFLTDDPIFTEGFECGMLWEKMKNSESFDLLPIHVANIKQIELICHHFGYEYKINSYDDEWSQLTANPVDISNLTPNTHDRHTDDKI